MRPAFTCHGAEFMSFLKLLSLLLLAPAVVSGYPGWIDSICAGYVVSAMEEVQARFGDTNGIVLMRGSELILPFVADVECLDGHIIGRTGYDYSSDDNDYFILDTLSGEVIRVSRPQRFNAIIDSLDLIGFPDDLLLRNDEDYFSQVGGFTVYKIVALLLPILFAVPLYRWAREKHRE